MTQSSSKLHQHGFGADRWTRDMSEFVWPILTRMSTDFGKRLKLLTAKFDPSTPGGEAVFRTIARVCSLPEPDIQAEYGIDLPPVLNAVGEEQLDDLGAVIHEAFVDAVHRWNALKIALDRLLPTVSAVDAEAVLRRLKKEKQESLLEFMTRFRDQAVHFIGQAGLSARKAGQIMYTKLPKELQRQFSIYDYDMLCNVDMLFQRVRERANWQAISESVWDTKDAMEIDAAQFAPKDEIGEDSLLQEEFDVNMISRFGRIDFKQVNTIGDFKDCLRNIALRKNSRLLQECKDILLGPQKNKYAPERPGPSRSNWRQSLAHADQFETSSAPEKVDQDSEDEIEEIPFVRVVNGADGSYGVRTSMLCQIKLNDCPTQALVDTGAEISTINVALCKRHGFLVDENRKQKITSFNDTKSLTLGMTKLEVTVGDQKFPYDFHVVGFNSHKAIIGFDMMRDKGFVPDPQDGKLYTSDHKAVRCQILKKDHSNDILEIVKTMDSALIPKPSKDYEVGFELRSPLSMKIPPRSRRLIQLGFKMSIPKSCFGTIYGMNHTILKGIDIGAGVIDPDYKGAIGIVVINNSEQMFEIEPGMVLGLLIIHNAVQPQVKEVKELNQSKEIIKTKQPIRTPSLPTRDDKGELKMMRKDVKWFPYKKGNMIFVPCNRSFFIRPGQGRDVWIPITCSKDVVLHPLFSNNTRVETGFIPKGQYFRFRVNNTSPDILHIVEKQSWVCFDVGKYNWSIKGADQSTSKEMHFLGNN